MDKAGGMGRVGARIRRLKTLPVFPTLLTAGNLACGITAILCAAHSGSQPGMLAIGAWMIFAAMICDMFDGKVARLTKTDGPFGAELDSLADVVSFGVAPAILVHRLVLGESGVFDHGVRLLWFITVFYAVMAAIRLARYNVEHVSDPVPGFRGLPSPGAAALIAVWVLLAHDPIARDWLVEQGLLLEHQKYAGLLSLDAYRWAILGVMVGASLLMVSTLRYPHAGEKMFSRISFRKMILLLMVGAAVLLMPLIVLLFLAVTGYVLIGMGYGAWQTWLNWRRGKSVLDDEDEDEAEDIGAERPLGDAAR